MPFGPTPTSAATRRRATVSGAVAALAAVAGLLLVVAGVSRQVFIERTDEALARASTGETLTTLGAGMLVFGAAGWWRSRRSARTGRSSWGAVVLAALSLAWPAWIGFVHWYDAR